MKHVLIASAVVSLLIICGCQYGSRHTLMQPKETNDQMVYLDLSLKARIPCNDMNATRLDDKRLRVCAEFYNNQNSTAECQIQVKYKDAGGRVIDSTDWMPLVLPRKELTAFENTSLSTQATDFVIMLRKAK